VPPDEFFNLLAEFTDEQHCSRHTHCFEAAQLVGKERLAVHWCEHLRDEPTGEFAESHAETPGQNDTSSLLHLSSRR